MSTEKSAQSNEKSLCPECAKQGKLKGQPCPHMGADAGGPQDSSEAGASKTAPTQKPLQTTFKLGDPQLRIKWTDEEILASQKSWGVQYNPENNGLIITPTDENGIPLTPEAFNRWAGNVVNAWNEFKKEHPELNHEHFNPEHTANRLTIKTPLHLSKKWDDFLIQKGLLHPELAKKMEAMRNALNAKSDEQTLSPSQQKNPTLKMGSSAKKEEEDQNRGYKTPNPFSKMGKIPTLVR